MKTSDTIAEIAAALSAAQSEMTGAKKESKNPFFKSSYSDLSSVMSAISKPFAENGLSFVQSPSFADNLVTVTTRLMHKSGEWIEGTVALPPTKNDAQGYGSAITYGKRYGLQAMAGVPSVDDDGNQASKAVISHITEKQASEIYDFIDATKTDVKVFCSSFGINSVTEMPPTLYNKAIALLKRKQEQL